MAITAIDIVQSLFEIAGEAINELYEHKCDNADDFNTQLQEVHEQYNKMCE